MVIYRYSEKIKLRGYSQAVIYRCKPYENVLKFTSH